MDEGEVMKSCLMYLMAGALFVVMVGYAATPDCSEYLTLDNCENDVPKQKGCSWNVSEQKCTFNCKNLSGNSNENVTKVKCSDVGCDFCDQTNGLEKRCWKCD
jgi:hypothetical protein